MESTAQALFRCIYTYSLKAGIVISPEEPSAFHVTGSLDSNELFDMISKLAIKGSTFHSSLIIYCIIAGLLPNQLKTYHLPIEFKSRSDLRLVLSLYPPIHIFHLLNPLFLFPSNPTPSISLLLTPIYPLSLTYLLEPNRIPIPLPLS